jgi:hypothetical protein
MAVTTDKCIQCSNRHRRSDLEPLSESLAPDGMFFGLPYWFCSEACYKKAVGKYLDPRYDFDKKAEDDKEYEETFQKAKNDYLDETSGGFLLNLFNKVASQSQADYMLKRLNAFVESFNVRKISEITGAEIELHQRLFAEWQHQIAEDQSDRDKEHIKIQDQIIKLAAEEKERRALQDAHDEMLEPKPIPFKYGFDHTHIIGSSGQGKSTLIIKHVLDYLLSPERPALVVIDPKGTMVNDLRMIESFSPTSQLYTEGHWEFPHLIVIDPTLFAPALNLFAPPKRTYSARVNEQLSNNTISLMQYVFSTKGSALTDKQMTCFSFAVALMFTIPNATIHTLLDLMNDPVPKAGGIPPTSPFKPYIDKLGPTSKRFFYDSFYNPTEYGATKDQISSRIYGMLRYPTFDAMFSTTQNNVDMFDHLQKGRIVLISSPKSILGTEGSQLFSRYMVALTLQAAFERIAISRDKWNPAFLIIDEAQDVIDEVKTPELLEQAREFKLGVTIAHQNIKGQLPDALFSSISANTRIKYAGTRSSQDATVMARDMHCEPEFIMKQPIGSFACFVGGMTEHPFTISLELGDIATYQKMGLSDFDGLVEKLSQFIGVDETHEGSTEPEPLRETMEKPAEAEILKTIEADTPILPQTNPDPSKPAKWTRK